MGGVTTARFDDRRPSRRRSFRLVGHRGTLEARALAEVPGVLAAAERAVACGLWVAGWVAYEAAPAFDRTLVVRPTAGTSFAALPLAWFAVFDGREAAGEPPGDAALGESGMGDWTATIDEERHAADVAAIREHIARGDTYQVNHTLRLSAPFAGDAAALYGRLARGQRGGYGAFLDAGRWAVASASPELFFSWSNGTLVMRPMKGTAPRGLDEASDAVARAALLASAKDRAENLMIVDMVRNDLGRIAIPGTVGVRDLFTAERYGTVWQLTSTVQARPRPGTALGDVFAALFPCASVTGAPRASTLRIIAALETTPRGVYCGAVGFGGPSPTGPRWVFNVAIRTALVDREAGVVWYGTGGGVTHDSTAAGEYAEALLKAEVLHRSAEPLGLVETMLWTPEAGLPLRERHLARLAASARHLDLPWDATAVEAVLAAALTEASGRTRVRLVLGPDGEVTVDLAPAPAPRVAPVHVAVDTVAVASDDLLGRHKTTQRARYERAAARHPDAEDVVLVNERGEVVETTIANLAAHLGGGWVTPPLASGCLPGVRRAADLDAGVLVEGVLRPDDLRRADAVVRLNALRGWEPLALPD